MFSRAMKFNQDLSGWCELDGAITLGRTGDFWQSGCPHENIALGTSIQTCGVNGNDEAACKK